MRHVLSTRCGDGLGLDGALEVIAVEGAAAEAGVLAMDLVRPTPPTLRGKLLFGTQIVGPENMWRMNSSDVANTIPRDPPLHICIDGVYEWCRTSRPPR